MDRVYYRRHHVEELEPMFLRNQRSNSRNRHKDIQYDILFDTDNFHGRQENPQNIVTCTIPYFQQNRCNLRDIDLIRAGIVWFVFLWSRSIFQTETRVFLQLFAYFILQFIQTVFIVFFIEIQIAIIGIANWVITWETALWEFHILWLNRVVNELLEVMQVWPCGQSVWHGQESIQSISSR